MNDSNNAEEVILLNPPSIFGFNDQHKDLKTDFIRRLVGILTTQVPELKSYQMAEDWSGNAQETIQLETEGLKIGLTITAKKGSV